MPDRRVSVGIDADVSPFVRSLTAAGVAAKGFAKELESSDSRLAGLVQTTLALAPALVPLGAAGIPAIAGLTTQLGFAAGAAGVAALAFNGIGDGLKAVNEAQLKPTTENVTKMNNALAAVGPAAAEFVAFLQDIRPQMAELQEVSRAGLFPGVQEGIESLMTRLPEVEGVVHNIATALGELAAEAGSNLAGDRWTSFFDYLETTARPILLDMGRTFGNFIEGISNMVMAFDPLSRSFSTSLLNMSRDFARWSDELAGSDGFQSFVQYIENVTPQAWDTLGALANALISLTEAAAPVGQALLPVIEVLANGLSAIASSPVGPILIGAAAGLSAVSRAIALYNVANGSALSGFLTKVGGSGAGMRAAAAGVGVFALSLTDLDDRMGLTNTAAFAMMGAFAGPWGAALGAAAGATLDAQSANDSLTDSIAHANDVLGSSSASFDMQKVAVQAAKEQLDEFTASVDGWAGAWKPSAIKNNIEGWFGKSDVEEGEAALQSLMDALDDTSGATDAFTGVTDRNTDGIVNNTDAILANIDAMREKRSQALAAFDAETAYAQALDDSEHAIAENGRTLDKSTEKGRANRSALSAQAAAWNNLSDSAKNTAGAHRAAIDAFVANAAAMGKDEDAARALAKRLLEIKPRDVKVAVDTAGARADVENLISSMTGRVIGIGVRVGSTDTPSWLHRADGGKVPGSSPTKRADNIPIMATAGEYMHQVDAVNYYGLSTMDAINNQRIPREALVGYADGGPIGEERRVIERPQYVRYDSGSSIDYNRLAAAIARTQGQSRTGEPMRIHGTLSIDESGRAFIRGVAADVVDDSGDYASTMGRMSR